MLQHPGANDGVKETRREGELHFLLEALVGGACEVMKHRITVRLEEITTMQIQAIPEPGPEQAAIGRVVAPPIEDSPSLREERPIPVEGADLVRNGDPASVFEEVAVVRIEGELLPVEFLQ